MKEFGTEEMNIKNISNYFRKGIDKLLKTC